MFKRFLYRVSIGALCALFSLALGPIYFSSADSTSLTLTATYVENELVILDLASANEISTLDPSLVSDVLSINASENLFHGLTDVEPISNQIVPELATSWETNEDGTTWTFHLRDDVMWMRYDPLSNTAEAIRPVVAQDVVFGIQRSCDPRLGGYYGMIAAQVVAGCDEVNYAPESNITDELVYGDTTKVSAPDDTTVVIHLQFAAGYFLSMTPMWMLRPMPQEAIVEFGDDWTRPGNIVTNGPYFIKENTRGVQRVFVRNDAHNPDLDYGGNVDVINYIVVEDNSTVFALYQDAQLDATGIPAAALENILHDDDHNTQLYQVFDLNVLFFGFAYDKEPFSNVHTRRAFSAIIDRNEFVEQILQGRGVPMIHLTPPGMAHAPPINEVGVGFDPIYAQTEFAEAGYANCENFPNINIYTFLDAGNWAEFWASSAEEYLGCSPELFTVEEMEFSVLIAMTDRDAPTQDRPHAFALGWIPDYADANNWVGDVLACASGNAFNRPCTSVDDLIQLAASTLNPMERDALYLEISEAFFGSEGEFPIAPIYMSADYVLRQPWYTGPFDSDGIFSGAHWDTLHVDMEAKLAARG